MTIIISNIVADGVNLVQNDMASGMPSPMAYLGLAAAMAPDLGLSRWDVRVLPVLHDIVVSPGRTKADYQSKDGVFKPQEIPETMIGRVRLSLVLDLPARVSGADVTDAFVGRRIAGGIVTQPGRIREAQTFGDALRAMPRGYALVPPRDAALQAVTTGEGDDLADIADLLFPAQKLPGTGWIVPAAVGWRLLEDPRTVPARRGTRNADIPHCFAEPVLGLGELISIRNPRLTGLVPADFAALFWSWQTRGDWILGHTTYADSLQKEISHG